jgi:hypothetical protein
MKNATYLSDTSAEAERVLTEVYRRMPVSTKWRQLGEDFQTARLLHAAGCRLRNPDMSSAEIQRDWMRCQYGVSAPLEGFAMDALSNLPILRFVLSVFDKLSIAYALGGSMASSIHGIPRFTRDADINVETFPGKEESLSRAFGADYYVSLPAIQEAVRNRSSFNIINTREGFKVDVFVCDESGFQQSVLRRRVKLTFPDATDQPIAVQSPEDVVLFKLHWYRLGRETSEQQWKDVLGVLKSKAEQLDEAFLDHWAAELKVADLLAQARAQSSIRE